MKNLNKYIAAIVTSFLSCSVYAATGEASKSFYGKAEVGVTMPKKLGSQSPFKIIDKEPKKGAIFGVEAGYKLSDSIRFGLNLNFAKAKAEKFNTEDEKTKTKTAFSGTDIKTFGADFNTYFDITDYKGVVPYVTAGIGVARNKLSAFEKVDSNLLSKGLEGKSRYGETETKYKDTKTDFAWNVGAGALYKVNSDVAVDLSYRYKDAGEVSAKKEHAEEGDKKYTAKLKSHNITFGVVYSF